jgi:hypothetical protein
MRQGVNLAIPQSGPSQQGPPDVLPPVILYLLPREASPRVQAGWGVRQAASKPAREPDATTAGRE